MITRIKYIIVLLAIFYMAGKFSVVSAQQDIPGLNSINSADLINTVTYLASAEMEGRQPASEGYYKAANFMMERLTGIGLKPAANNNSYYQDVPVEFCHITGDPSFDLIQKDGTKKSYRLGEDFVCRGQTGFGDVTGEVVFCGYGISEPSLGYDDYADIDVKGKIVMVFKQNPSWEIKGFDAGDKYNRYRANMAAAHGALAVILVSTPLSADPQKPIGSIMDGSGTYDEKFPQIHIDIPIAEELLKLALKTKLKDLQSRLDSLKSPCSMTLGIKVHIKIEGEYIKNKRSMNVLALLPGCDPILSKEYLVISAHLDHVGKQGTQLYFPGANDDASGSAAVLEIAEAFVKGGVKPKHSIIFALYTSEEQGLCGSKYFAEHCPVPVDSIVAALNLDCVGYGDSIQVGAGKANPVLWHKAWEHDSLTSKLMTKSTWQGGGADLDALYQLRVPGLYFVTRNSYAHLHLPSDKPETLNKELFEKLVKVTYCVAYRVAMGEYSRETVQKK